jgi:predicted nucleic acid-binding protein
MTWDEALHGVRTIGLDTAPIIYFVEAHPRYDARVTQLFEQIAAGRLLGVASVIALAEVLVVPLRNSDLATRDQYSSLLRDSDNVRLVPVTAQMAERAAELRSVYGLRLPDALQLATAIEAGCEALVTNDSMMKRVTELRIIVLDDIA